MLRGAYGHGDTGTVLFHKGNVLFHGGVHCSRPQFLHLFSAADDGNPGVLQIDHDVSTVLAAVKLHMACIPSC